MGRLKLIGVLAAGILAVGCCAQPLNPKNDGFKGEQQHLVVEAWRDACRLSRYDCTGLPMPSLRYSKLAEMHGVYGMYTGGRTVYLVPSMKVVEKKSQAYLVLVHEMVHYIETKINRAGMNRMSVCLSEEEAFEVDGELAVELGMPELDRRKTWIVYYPACQPRRITLKGKPPEDTGLSE